jgi:uncharacterized protein YdeI (YjbR/CyaY-like superfamily)
MDTIPPEFSAALKSAGLEKIFAGCTPAHRREYLKWIGAAKKPATRDARIAQAVKMIAAKQKQETKARHQW